VSRTRKLDSIEIRVLGVLLEKEQTTPDQYPLTTLAVVNGANPKTNREPVTQLTETEVTEALDRLREDVLVWRSQSARAERWEHRLDRRWQLDGAAKAVMTLLLLRGPQTPGELRTRSDRMHPFESVDEVEAVLQRLSDGFDALVRELPRQPGQRETRWMHLEGLEDPEAALEADPAPAPVGREEPDRDLARRAGSPPAGGNEARLASLEAALDELREEVAALRAELRALLD
jgi:uncharacterized protein YceH (UPF0502 family)